MRTIHCKLFLCCLLMVTLPFATHSLMARKFIIQKNDGIPVQLDPVITVPEGAPRTPTYNPFWAQYSFNTVSLGSLDNYYGVVSVSLVSTAGDFFFCAFDTNNGSVNIPISGLSGDYTLIVVISDRLSFQGEFEL